MHWRTLGIAVAAACVIAAPLRAAELDALFAAEWDRQMQEEPVRASLLGDRRFNNRWPDRRLATIEREHQQQKAVLARIEAVDPTKLTPAERLNRELFLRQYRAEIAEFAYGQHLLPINQRGGIQTADEVSSSLRFTTIKDYEDWITRLENFGPYMDQTIALMEEGMRRRVLLPKVLLERVPPQIARQIVDNPDESGFFRPFRKWPADIPQSERDRLSAAARAAIKGQVVPAFGRLKTFFEGRYLGASFEQVGIWQIPEGDRYYELLARRYTTTDLTPRQIHELGLSEVKRIRAQMQAIIVQVGFKGSFSEFLTSLRTEPRFYYKSSDELLSAYRAISKRIDPGMVKLFGKLPRVPYGVEPIPAAIAPDTTTAYYNRPAADGSRAGTYYVNLYKPETRPKYEMMALSLHEAVPGHHLQIAIAQELGALPNFRRYGGYTAFSEGWGLYAESLGDDLGLYEDPYDKFGQLTYEMWRAVRLVVDTGMHSLRWDRKKAIAYFLENAAKSELDVVNEIDRYISNPGQALAYKIGELKFKELRARSKRELGERFDLREFHDVALGSGAVPLDVLDSNVDAWLKARKTAANQPSP